MCARCSRHQVRVDDRCAPHQIFGSPREHQNVSEFEESLLVGENEERITEFVSRCMTCQQIKAEHKKSPGLLHPLDIPKWKWEDITMDFVSGLLNTRKGNDAIWVVVDRLTKSAHFLPFKTGQFMKKMTTLYRDNIVKLRDNIVKPHGVPKSIESDRDPKFVSRFWSTF